MKFFLSHKILIPLILLILIPSALLFFKSAFQGTSFDTRIKGLDTQINALYPKLGSYPPDVKDDSELKQVKNDWQTAVSEGENLVKEVPEKDQAYVHYQLGELYRLGHNLDAPQAFENSEKNLLLSINEDPNLIEAKFSLGSLYVNTSPQFAPKAEQLFLEALAQAKGNNDLLRAYDGLFFAYYYQGKLSQAKIYVDKALEI